MVPTLRPSASFAGSECGLWHEYGPLDLPDWSLVRPSLVRQESPCSAVVTSTPLGNACPWRVLVYLPHNNSRLELKGLFVFPLPGRRVWGREWRRRISPGNGGAGCAETVRGPHASPLRAVRLCADAFILCGFTSVTENKMISFSGAAYLLVTTNGYYSNTLHTAKLPANLSITLELLKTLSFRIYWFHVQACAQLPLKPEKSAYSNWIAMSCTF